MVNFFLPVLVWSAMAPVPKTAEKREAYFSTQVGTKLVYQIGKRESVEMITDVVEREGVKLVTIGHESKGKITPHHIVVVSEQGFGIVDSDVASLETVFWLLKLPHTDGQKWKVTLSPMGVEPGSGTLTAHGPEPLEVPAGKFQTIRVEMDIMFLGERRRSTVWYAPGIGRVKEVSGDRVEVLKSYEFKK